MDVSIVLKDSDTESENFCSLIQLSVSDGQKTDSSNVVSFIGIYLTVILVTLLLKLNKVDLKGVLYL